MTSPTQSLRPTAPRDYIQFFLSILTKEQADALLVADATGSNSLFIARSKEAALRFIQQDSEQTRAHLLDLDRSISDADGTLPADTIPGPARSLDTTPDLPSHQPSQANSPIPASDTSIVPSASQPNPAILALDTSIVPLSHDNSVHEESTQPAKKRRRENYVPLPSSHPVSPSPGNGEASPCLPKVLAPSEAKLRVTLTKQYLPEVTWLMAQKDPPLTITDALHMITKAKEIGNGAIIQSWKAICTHLRMRSTPTTINLYTPNPSSSQTLATPLHLQGASLAVQAFYSAFQAVNQSEVNGSLQLMFHRHYFADLFYHYRQAETALAAEPLDERPHGVTDAALVKMRLFRSLHPEHTELANPRTNPKSKRDWDNFHTKLEKGRRWLYLRDKTNPGILALIPESVSNRWIEKDLHFKEFCTWVDLIIFCNQSAITLGKAMLGLQHALSSQSMPEKKIRLEITNMEDLNGYSDTSVLFEEVS